MDSWIVALFWIIAAIALAGIIYGLITLRKDIRREIYAGAGIAVCSTLIISTSILQAESSITNAREEADWKERMQYQEKIRGFNPGSHPSWKEINFSTKDMTGAQFQSRNANGIRMRDATLNEANFTNSQLNGANLAGSTFDNAIFFGADLRGADLRDAHLEFSDIQNAASLKGATVSAGTCWPQGFMKKNSDMTRHLKIVGKKITVIEDGATKQISLTEKGRETPNCLLGRGGK